MKLKLILSVSPLNWSLLKDVLLGGHQLEEARPQLRSTRSASWTRTELDANRADLSLVESSCSGQHAFSVPSGFAVSAAKCRHSRRERGRFFVLEWFECLKLPPKWIHPRDSRKANPRMCTLLVCCTVYKAEISTFLCSTFPTWAQRHGLVHSIRLRPICISQ